MKKITVLLSILFFSKLVSAQYFIPLFNPVTDTMIGCNLLITDTLHNYLYIGTGDTTNYYVLAYRNNAIEATTFPPFENAKMGCVTKNGLLGIIAQVNYDFISVDSLAAQTNVYGFTSASNVGVRAMTTNNDTIYYDNDINFGPDQVEGITPSGTHFVLGQATGGSVTDLEFYNGKLYACGTYTSISPGGGPYINYWDGTNWVNVSTAGIDWGSLPGIQSIELYQNHFIGGGAIDSVNGIPSKNIAFFNGISWEPITGLKNGGGGGSEYHGKLYFFGGLLNFNNVWYGLATYETDSLEYNYNIGPLNNLSTTAVFQDTIFIGGHFDHAGYVPCHNIVKFVDNSFSSFATVTTKWWYNSSDNGVSVANSSYTYYEVIKDTFVMNTPASSGFNCRKIKAEQHHPNGSVTVLQPLYVFGDTTSVKYYNNYQERFVPLYKFDVSTGDTVSYYTPQPQTASDTIFRVVVDSVTLLNIQGTNYKRVWSTPLDGWSFGNHGYVQLIGGMGSMLPQPINYYVNEGPLRCYQDTSVFYHYMVSTTCDSLYCPPNFKSVTAKLCEGDIYDFYGTPLTTSGSYTTTVSVGLACDTVVTLLLDVTPINHSIAISGDSLVATGNGTIQWYDCTTETIVTGANDSIFVPSNSDSYAAIFSFDICTDTTACLHITGIEQLTMENGELIIYPNPAGEQLIIVLRQAQHDIREIEITDLLGRVVLKQSVTPAAKKVELNISILSSGVYFIKVFSTQGAVTVKKVVKE